MSTEDRDIDMDQTFDPTALASLRAALEDDEFVLGLAAKFLVETPGRIAALTAATREGDLSAIVAAAHLIKGSALTFGAPRLVNLCAALEASPSEARSLVAAVAHEFDELSGSLSKYMGDVRAGDPLVRSPDVREQQHPDESHG